MSILIEPDRDIGSTSMQLQPGLFSSCGVQWDKEAGTFNAAPWSASTQCCMDQCVRPVTTCKDSCHGSIHAAEPDYLHRCLRTCEVSRDMCLKTCFLTSVGTTYSRIILHGIPPCGTVDIKVEALPEMIPGQTARFP